MRNERRSKMWSRDDNIKHKKHGDDVSEKVTDPVKKKKKKKKSCLNNSTAAMAMFRFVSLRGLCWPVLQSESFDFKNGASTIRMITLANMLSLPIWWWASRVQYSIQGKCNQSRNLPALYISTAVTLYNGGKLIKNPLLLPPTLNVYRKCKVGTNSPGQTLKTNNEVIKSDCQLASTSQLTTQIGNKKWKRRRQTFCYSGQ